MAGMKVKRNNPLLLYVPFVPTVSSYFDSPLLVLVLSCTLYSYPIHYIVALREEDIPGASQVMSAYEMTQYMEPNK